ncbi:MAG: hypothetical protein WCS88_02530 [Patescibacteria group bacterium]|jgi:hypothetical protein
MLDILSGIFDIFWHIIQYGWEIIFAVFHLEEWLINLFKSKDIPIWVQLITLLPFNTIMIGVETLFFRQLRRLKRFFKFLWLNLKAKLPITLRYYFSCVVKAIQKKLFNDTGDKKTEAPRFLLTILNGRPIGRRVLFFLALIPECQKVGAFCFGLQMEKLGWQGYAALCLGGATKLTIIILSPTWVLWTVVIGAMSFNAINWLINRFNKSATVVINEDGKK